jgi:uracil phosphoribosyltransferase
MSKREHSVESSTRTHLTHDVDLKAGTCSCEATVRVCRHVRIAKIRAYKAHTAKMIERYRHELMDTDERLELREAIIGR